MPEEITDPVMGTLTLLGRQLNHTGKLIAEMRTKNENGEKLENELTFIGYLQQRIYTICQFHELDHSRILDDIYEAKFPIQREV